jgi:hypothetical protein
MTVPVVATDRASPPRWAFAVLVETVESDEPERETVFWEMGDAIHRASTLAKQGRRAYVCQLLTIAEPSYHLTDLREKGNG